jgi:heme/copper-type cytochrome/quinol oxidase subunit 2
LFSSGLLYSFNFQYPNREVYFFRTFFHDFIIVGLVFIVTFVLVIFFLSLTNTSNVKRKNSLEIYLMLVPILFLFFLRIPSMLLLQQKGGEFDNTEDVYVDASQ